MPYIVDNINTAISILKQGVDIAQKQGVYNFQESAWIASAIDYINSISESKNEDDTGE